MSPAELPIKPRFYFHAEGHALSGQFRRPVQRVIEAQASTSLPTIGGTARNRVENFSADHLATFKVGHTHASGSQQDAETYTTHVTSTIEDLNILDVITADRIVSHLTSQHKRGKMEGHILALGTHFDNLRIGGYEVKVTLRHELFIDCEDFAALRNKVASDGNSGKIAVTGDRTALCSLVEKIETKLPMVDGLKHVLHVPHFGMVSLAEVFAEPGARTLTMLRLDLGSPTAATLTVAEGKINGYPWP
jgi:hypothetical protein